MEISPDDLSEMIQFDEETNKQDMIDIVDTYLYTATEMICESIYKKLSVSKGDSYAIRLGKSIQHQLSMYKDEFISPLTKEYLDKINIIIEKQ